MSWPEAPTLSFCVPWKVADLPLAGSRRVLKADRRAIVFSNFVVLGNWSRTSDILSTVEQYPQSLR